MYKINEIKEHLWAMEISSHAQRALALLHKQGFLRTRDLDTIGARGWC